MTAFFLGLVAGAGAQEQLTGISGGYAEEGVVVEDPAGLFRGRASLHALLALEFDPALAELLHEETSRVWLGQGDSELEVRVYNVAGEVLTRTRWQLRTAGHAAGDRVLVHCRKGEAVYVLEFENVAENQLLRVKITRKVETIFGPVTGAVGVCVFPRLP